ncbi:uncharacterized protein TRAVEDRAFT_48837, partial [Trametes versicolor FP-101664 SS1]|uniref:uncharacterized protein n=1 Tax=Trametes versicolor (strain FP-101664) TaxID=717944 RepID=UPI0004622E64
MAGRTTRTRVAASTGGKVPKAVAKKAAAPAQARGAKAAAKRKTAAPARKALVVSATKGKTVRGKAARAIDSDAEEGSDESDIQTESDLGMEEAAADNTSDNKSVSADVMMISDDEEDSRQEVELTPKIGRSRAANSSPPSTPKTPSPVKAGRGRAVKPKSTPAKHAKQVDSEDSEDEGISPVKKVKTALAPGKQSFVPLPRTQTIRAQIAAERAAAEKANKIMVDKDVQTELSGSADRKVQTKQRSSVKVVIPMRKTPGKSKNTPVKASNTGKAAKTSKAPNSDSSVFTRETDDKDKARLQRRLFTDHLPEPLRTIQDHGSSKDTANMSSLDSGEEEDDAAMEDLADDVTNKLVLDVDNPDVVDEALRDTYQGLPVVRFCEALTADGSLISTVPYTQGLVNKHDVNPSALKRLATFSNDGGYVINPARFDPAKVTLSTFGQSANKVLSWKPQSGQPARAICMTMGFVFTCNVVFPTLFGKQ